MESPEEVEDLVVKEEEDLVVKEEEAAKAKEAKNFAQFSPTYRSTR